jgi:thymidine kinase
MLTVITGCMYAGKTTALIRHINRNTQGKQTGLIIKHALDTRYSIEYLATHDESSRELYQDHRCVLAKTSGEVKELMAEFVDEYGGCDTLFFAIDEVQFFDSDIVNVVLTYAAQYDVIVAGLNRDANNQTFGSMGDLLAHADAIECYSALCWECRGAATHTRLIDKNKHSDSSDNFVLVGAKNTYVPLCRKCWNSATESIKSLE